MPNEFFSPEGDLEKYFLTDYKILDQYSGDQLWGWGTNYSSSLGINNDLITVKSTPVTTFAGQANWSSISSGGAACAAIKIDGTLWVWGYNNSGVLASNTFPDILTPVTTFAGGSNWKQVACGYYMMAAIKTDGTLWTWGDGNSGTIGNNTTNYVLTPITTFAGGTNWKQVACTNDTMAAIKIDGTLWVWGRGPLGHNALSISHTPITTFAGGTNWKQVFGGQSAYHISAIKTDGTLWSWGSNIEGGVGINNLAPSYVRTPVTTFAGGTNWKQVSVSRDCTAAIKTDGTLWTWGNNSNNQPGKLGDNTTISKLTPVTTFAGGTTWKQVSGGYGHLAAIKIDGTLWGWGADYYSQLGTVNPVVVSPFGRLTPITTSAGGSDWKQVACGYYYTVAIKLGVSANVLS